MKIPYSMAMSMGNCVTASQALAAAGKATGVAAAIIGLGKLATNLPKILTGIKTLTAVSSNVVKAMNGETTEPKQSAQKPAATVADPLG